MCNLTENEFYSRKMELLRQCLSLSEEFISSLDEWESLQEILSRRSDVIKEIERLEDLTDKVQKQKLSETQKKEMDQLIKLILDLDQDAEKMLKVEQDNILHSIKTNVQEQKLVQYGAQPYSQSGKRLDYRK